MRGHDLVDHEEGTRVEDSLDGGVLEPARDDPLQGCVVEARNSIG